MDKEKLEKRLFEIEEAIKNQNQLISQEMANLNMLEGGRQECLFWLSQLEGKSNVNDISAGA